MHMMLSFVHALFSSVVHMMYRRLSAVTWCTWRHCA